MDPDPLKKSSSQAVLQLYQMLYDIDNIFKENAIDYWMDGGTLLGAVRNKGLIPWDDDADINIQSRDIYKMMSLKPELEKLGLLIAETAYCYKIYSIHGKIIMNEKTKKPWEWTFPFVDVFGMEIRKNYWHFSKRAAQRAFGNKINAENLTIVTMFHQDEVFPLKEYDFGEIKLMGPHNPNPYLDKLYGSDWNIIGYKNYDHSLEKPLEITKVPLTEEDKKPAQPTGPILRRI